MVVNKLIWYTNETTQALCYTMILYKEKYTFGLIHGSGIVRARHRKERTLAILWTLMFISQWALYIQNVALTNCRSGRISVRMRIARIECVSACGSFLGDKNQGTKNRHWIFIFHFGITHPEKKSCVIDLCIIRFGKVCKLLTYNLLHYSSPISWAYELTL